MQENTKSQSPRAVHDGPYQPSPHWPFHCRQCGREITEYYTCHAAWPSLSGLCARCITKPHQEHRCGALDKAVTAHKEAA